MIHKNILSVIVPTYNRSALLNLTLKSLRKQTLSNELYEVIVCDDGSDDDSFEVTKSFAGSINVRYVWQKDEGYRVAEARNLGADIAKGKYLVFLDSGILLSSIALENLLLTLTEKESTPRAVIGLIHGFGIEDKKTIINIRHLAQDNVDACLSWLTEHNYHDPRTPQIDEIGRDLNSWPAPFDIFWGGLIGVHKKEFDKVGGFDNAFNSWGGEDVDLGIRLYLDGCEFALADGVESVHWPHETDSNLLKEKRALECAKALHRKYGLWQTEYYVSNKKQAVLAPINIMIDREQQENILEVSHAEL